MADLLLFRWKTTENVLKSEAEIWPFAHAQWKIRYKTLIYGGIAEIPLSYTKSGSRNTMMTSDFKPEVEI